MCEREGENQTHDSLFLTDSAPSLSLSLPCCLSLVAVTVDVVAVVVVTQKHTETHRNTLSLAPVSGLINSRLGMFCCSLRVASSTWFARKINLQSLRILFFSPQRNPKSEIRKIHQKTVLLLLSRLAWPLSRRHTRSQTRFKMELTRATTTERNATDD